MFRWYCVVSIYLDPLLVSAGDGGFAFWCWTWEITTEVWPRLGISEGEGSLEGIGVSLVRSKQRLWAASVRCLRNCSSKLLSSWEKNISLSSQVVESKLLQLTNAQWIMNNILNEPPLSENPHEEWNFLERMEISCWWFSSAFPCPQQPKALGYKKKEEHQY